MKTGEMRDLGKIDTAEHGIIRANDAPVKKSSFTQMSDSRIMGNLCRIRGGRLKAELRTVDEPP